MAGSAPNRTTTGAVIFASCAKLTLKALHASCFGWPRVTQGSDVHQEHESGITLRIQDGRRFLIRRLPIRIDKIEDRHIELRQDPVSDIRGKNPYPFENIVNMRLGYSDQPG